MYEHSRESELHIDSIFLNVQSNSSKSDTNVIPRYSEMSEAVNVRNSLVSCLGIIVIDINWFWRDSLTILYVDNPDTFYIMNK